MLIIIGLHGRQRYVLRCNCQSQKSLISFCTIRYLPRDVMLSWYCVAVICGLRFVITAESTVDSLCSIVVHSAVLYVWQSCVDVGKF